MAVSQDAKLGGSPWAALRPPRCCLQAWAGWRYGLRRLVNEATAPRWLVLATRQLSARPGYAVVQVSSLAVGLLALVLLVLLRTDLIASWRQPRRRMRPTALSSTSSPSRRRTSRPRCSAAAWRATTGTP
jgi:putative ABC transport system permease protein